MYFCPYSYLRLQKDLTERRLALRVNLARVTIRNAISSPEQANVSTLKTLSDFFDRDLNLLVVPKESCASEDSIVAASIYIIADGFDSWKIHLMNSVDRFRATLDPRLIILPPVKTIDKKINAVLASTVLTLCDEVAVESPGWAKKSYFLEKPWFVAGLENLKASALIESPLHFRKNNIFVLSNFLERA